MKEKSKTGREKNKLVKNMFLKTYFEKFEKKKHHQFEQEEEKLFQEYRIICVKSENKMD